MKRYGEYKETNIPGICRVPKHWDIVRNKFVFNESKNLVGSNSDEYTLLSLTKKGVIKRDLENLKGKFPASFDNYKIVKPNQIIFCLFDIDETPRTVGVSNYNGMITSAYNVFDIVEGISNNYIYYYYLHLDNNKMLKPYYSGLRKTVSRDVFNSMNMVLPPKKEQDKIATYLDDKTSKIDQLIAIEEKKKEKMVKLKESIISKVVTKGLNPNVEMKDSGVDWIDEVPDHWNVSRLKYYVDVFGRIGFRGYNASDLVDKGLGAITLSPGNIENDKITFDKCSYLSWNKYWESPEIQAINGDILFVKTGSSYGKSCLIENLPIEATINPQLILFKNIKLNNKFLHYALNNKFINKQIEYAVIGGTIPTLSQFKILNFKILIPNKEEQEQIVAYLDEKISKIDADIENINNKISQLQSLKQSLISEVVTGQIDVRDL